MIFPESKITDMSNPPVDNVSQHGKTTGHVKYKVYLKINDFLLSNLIELCDMVQMHACMHA